MSADVSQLVRRLGTRWRCLVCDTLVWDTYDRCHYCGSKRGEH